MSDLDNAAASSDSPMNRTIDFPPLENGVDYLDDAVHRLGKTPGPRDLKYAVLHLHAGLEVLLKYRLICEDWRLILDTKSADATEQDYETGEFRSIGVAEAIKRLKEIDDVTITAGQGKAAAALEKFRNQLQHHGLTSTAEAIEAQAVKALTFIVQFIDRHITPDVHLFSTDEEVLDRSLPGIRTALGEINALVEQRMQQLHPVLDAMPRTWCPDCGQPAVLLDSGERGLPVNIPAHDQPRCAFCTRRWDSRQSYVEEFTSFGLGLSLQDSGEDPTLVCEECSEQMVVWFDPATGDRGPCPIARCFACEEEFNDRCIVCHQTPVQNPNPREEGVFCSLCHDWMGAKD